MDLVKYKQLYRVIFKDEKEDDKLITTEQFELFKNKLFKNEWIEIDNELFSPFEIRKIKKFQLQDWITQRLATENQNIQKIVKGYMRLYEKEINLWVLENMISKAKMKFLKVEIKQKQK